MDRGKREFLIGFASATIALALEGCGENERPPSLVAIGDRLAQTDFAPWGEAVKAGLTTEEIAILQKQGERPTTFRFSYRPTQHAPISYLIHGEVMGDDGMVISQGFYKVETNGDEDLTNVEADAAIQRAGVSLVNLLIDDLKEKTMRSDGIGLDGMY